MHYFREMDPMDPYKTLEWGVFEQTVAVGGKERRFLTYIPDGTRSATAVAIVLGPNGCLAENLLENSGWRELAADERNREKFIVFFLEPEQGIWHTDEAYGLSDNDVAYVSAVFAKGCERFHYCIHESKNYLFGVREGGCIAQMAAMAEPALYAGLATIGADDVSDAYCTACGRDACTNLDGFIDLTARKGIRKGDIPMPVWIVDDPKCGFAENALRYWKKTNRTDDAASSIDDTTVEYTRSAEMEHPTNQDKRACRIRRSEWCGASANYGAAHIGQIWRDFLTTQQRWMADPGGSLRMVQHPVNDLHMEHHVEEIGGWMREWYVYVPQSVRNATEKSVPVVFAFHGYSCTGEIYAGNSEWHQIAEENGFIVIYPSAIPGKLDVEAPTLDSNFMLLPSWNYMNADPNAPDDFLFFREMLRRVSEAYPVDRSRVYATGHSQGSMMTQSLALAFPEVFAAVAPCSGVILAPSFDEYAALPEFCRELPVPIWMFAGQEEQWLIEAQPRMDNATGKTIDLWHRRNGLVGSAEEGFENHWVRYKDRWQDLCYRDRDGRPMLRYTQVEYFPHATMPEMSRRICDEFFAHWSRTIDGPVYNKAKRKEIKEEKS